MLVGNTDGGVELFLICKSISEFCDLHMIIYNYVSLIFKGVMFLLSGGFHPLLK